MRKYDGFMVQIGPLIELANRSICTAQCMTVYDERSAPSVLRNLRRARDRLTAAVLALEAMYEVDG